jgi:GDP-D-mannose 3',5'-epimerase
MSKQKTALVLGAGGFIGSHMVKRLKSEGYWVRGVDIKTPDFSKSAADEFVTRDLRDADSVRRVLEFRGYQGNFSDALPTGNIDTFDEIYQFAADMGGAGYIFSGVNDAHVMHNSATINLNVLECQMNINQKYDVNKTKIFYSSSACMYPEHNQEDPDNPLCTEDSAYPANPDSEYGWEKLFSERLYFAYNRNHKIPVRVARFHNIFGPEGTWDGGKEKAPAAICRKVIMSKDNTIEVWGDGKQTRSFLYIDECIEAVRRMMESEFMGPVNIGSEEMVTINRLVEIVSDASGRNDPIRINHIEGPLGVRGRNSDNTLIRKELGWDYKQPLVEGIAKTYAWIKDQVEMRDGSNAS